MDIYDSSYFNINKKLLVLVGLWPFESRGKKFISRFIFAGGLVAMLIPQVIALTVYIGVKIDRTLLHILTIIYISMTLIKLIASILMENQMKILYEDIASNWQMITDKNEKEKLEQHSQRARYITIAILTYFFVGDLAYSMIPLTSIVLNKLQPLNESRPRLFVMEGEFLVDPDKHYMKIMFDLVTLPITVIVVGSVDTMYATCVEHCVGLFSILKYRLKVPHRVICDFYTGTDQDATYQWIVETIRLHQKVLLLSSEKMSPLIYFIKLIICNISCNTVSFKDTVAASFSTSFLILMGLNMLNISILSVLILISSKQYLNLVRYGVLLFRLSMHLFYLSWPGQQLINYSTGLFRDAYLNEWYEGSERSKKILRILTLRCAQPCEIAAGGLYVMNFENFASVMKTSASYITVFSSIINR